MDLTVENAVPYTISAEFLGIDDLLQICQIYLARNINQIIAQPI